MFPACTAAVLYLFHEAPVSWMTFVRYDKHFPLQIMHVFLNINMSSVFQTDLQLYNLQSIIYVEWNVQICYHTAGFINAI